MTGRQVQSRGWRRTLAGIGGVIAALALLGPAAAQQGFSICGDLQNAYGPYDYRTDRHKLSIVENFHFTPAVEALISGKSGSIGSDIDYTLRAFPNHHRALIAMMRYGERLKTPKPPRANYSIDCYFDRALRFQPDDHIVRMILAGHLAKTGREPAAVKQLEIATEAAQDNPLSHYNIGLVYFDMKHYDKALVQAHKALELGMPRLELKNQLAAVGRWVEP